MANEYTYSAAADVRATHLLNREIHYTLADMSDLRSLCQQYEYTANGSLALKVGKMSPALTMAAPGEDTAPSNTALSDGNYTLTPARYALRLENTDLVSISSPDGGFDDAALINLIVGSYGRTFTSVLTALFSSLSNDVGGGASVDFSVDYAFDAMFQLNVSLATGAQAFVLKPHSFNELITSLRGETGALAYTPATAELMMAKGYGFMGTWLGRDIYSTDHVVEGSGVANNALLSAGAFAFLEAPVSKMIPMIDRRVAYADSNVFVTDSWQDDTAKFRKIGNAYFAIAEQEDARACLIASDDT